MVPVERNPEGVERGPSHSLAHYNTPGVDFAPGKRRERVAIVLAVAENIEPADRPLVQASSDSTRTCSQRTMTMTIQRHQNQQNKGTHPQAPLLLLHNRTPSY